MASVDSETQRCEAVTAGWRTFRTREADHRVGAAEIVCPASAEAGHLTTCALCNLCRGRATTAKDIVIIAHGNRTAKYNVPLLPFADTNLFEDPSDDRPTEN